MSDVFVLVVVLKEAPVFGPFSPRYKELSKLANDNLWSLAKVVGVHTSRQGAETQATELGFRIQIMHENVCPTDEYAYIVEQTIR